MTKPFLSGMPRLAFFAVVFCFCACDSGTGVNGGGAPGAGGEDAVAASWLTGDWKGNYKNKEADEDASLRETNAEATFKETAARTGDFTIRLPALDKVSVSGIYHDFQGKSLLLEIKESNLSTVGSPESNTELSYNLVGDALELYNDRITIRLVRSADPGSDDDDDDDDNDKDPNKDAAIDDWLCQDGQGFTWKIEIDEASFALDVFDQSGARESVWMKGDVKITRGQTDADAVLTVTSSGQGDKYKGLELRGNTVGTNLMNLRRMVAKPEGGQAVGEVMQCNSI